MTLASAAVGRAHRRLDAAETIDLVLAGVALFLQELPQAGIEEIAPDCRPRRVASQEDVMHWSRRLDRQKVLAAPGTRSHGFRVVHDFFTHAAARMQRLRHRRDPEPPSVMPGRAAPPGPRPSARPLS